MGTTFSVTSSGTWHICRHSAAFAVLVFVPLDVLVSPLVAARVEFRLVVLLFGAGIRRGPAGGDSRNVSVRRYVAVQLQGEVYLKKHDVVDVVTLHKLII